MPDPQNPKIRTDAVIGEFETITGILRTRCVALAADLAEARASAGELQAKLKDAAELIEKQKARIAELEAAATAPPTEETEKKVN